MLSTESSLSETFIGIIMKAQMPFAAIVSKFLEECVCLQIIGQVQYYRVPSLEKHNYYKGCKMEPFVPHSLCGRIFVVTVHSVC